MSPLAPPRRSSWRARLVWVSLASAVLLSPRAAGAFCRTRTCEFSGVDEPASEDRRNPQLSPRCRPDASGCATVGSEVFWPDACVSFAVQRDGSAALGIAALDVAELAAAGFAAWGAADCDGRGGTPELTGIDLGRSACSAVEYNCQSGANLNLIVFRDGPSALRPDQLALTGITANLRTGEILDADIELNAYAHAFSLPGDASSGPDLGFVLTHEIGHLLGLSHSFEGGALMDPYYFEAPAAADDGGLGLDDAAGMCAVYPPSERRPDCAEVARLDADAACVGSQLSGCFSPAGANESPVNEGCGCRLESGAGSRRSWALLGSLLAIIGARRGRRRGRDAARR